MVPLGIRQFQTQVEKCQEIEDMKNTRVNRGGNSIVGEPIRPNNYNNNYGKQVTKPYQHPQNNRGPNRPTNSPQGNQMGGKQICYRCGQEGNYANDCKNNAPICFNCKKLGYCPSRSFSGWIGYPTTTSSWTVLARWYSSLNLESLNTCLQTNLE